MQTNQIRSPRRRRPADVQNVRGLDPRGIFPAYTGPDHLTEEGAKALVRRLQDFWHQYKTAKFWAEYQPEHIDRRVFIPAMWVVRSNLVGGWPPQVMVSGDSPR
jgi:hypothetical protein